MKKKSKKYVDRSVLLDVFREVESLVVSLDKLGSAFSKDCQKCDRVTGKYLVEWGIANHFAGVRRALSELFSTKLGSDGMDEVEREVQNVEYWSFSRRKPSSRWKRRWKKH
jgi:hypothetical protein